MDICEKCFDSTSVSQYIQEFGEVLDNSMRCENCNNFSKYRIAEFQLKEKIQNIILKLYSHEYEHGLVGSASMMMEKGDNIDMFLPMTKSLSDICYELFDIDDEIFYNLLAQKHKDDCDYFNNQDDEVWINMGCDWADEHRIKTNWEKFSETVKYKTRFFDNKSYSRVNELSHLNSIFETLTSIFDTEIYRARECNLSETHDKIKENPSSQLGKAPSEYAGYNRFSPAGISYVYLADKDNIAIKEIRARDRDKVAVGKFEISNLELIDLRKETLESIIKNPFSESFSAEIFCNVKLLQNFVEDISQEVNESDKLIDYIPTQILAEYIRSLGYEGFIFDSSLCDGYNYLLFDDDKLKFINYTIIN